MEVMQFILQEFVQKRTVEQIVVPVGHGVEVYLLQKELAEKVDKMRAEDSGGDSTCASGAHPRTNCGADCRYPFATDLGGDDGSSAVCTTHASESYGRTDRGRLLSPDSGGNFRVGVIRHACHLAQFLRAQATRSQVSSCGRAVRRTLKP